MGVGVGVGAGAAGAGGDGLSRTVSWFVPIEETAASVHAVAVEVRDGDAGRRPPATGVVGRATKPAGAALQHVERAAGRGDRDVGRAVAVEVGDAMPTGASPTATGDPALD